MKLILVIFLAFQVVLGASDLIYGSSANPVLTSINGLVPKSVLTVTNGQVLKVVLGSTTHNPYRFFLLSTNLSLKLVTDDIFTLTNDDFISGGSSKSGYPYHLHKFGTNQFKVYRLLNELHGQVTLQLTL